MTKIEAEAKLNRLPDGSFLVRDSSTGDSYTLTVKHAGKCKCLKIYSKDNFYGLKDYECVFESLPALISHYGTHSLSEFNKTLTTALFYPVLKPHVRKEKVNVFEALTILSNEARKYLRAKKKYSLLMAEHYEISKELHLLLMEAKGLQVSIEMYGNISKLAIDVEDSENASPKNKQILQDNTSLLSRRYASTVEKSKEIAEKIKYKEKEQALSLHRVNEHVNCLLTIEEYCSYVRDQVLCYGANPDFIDCLLNEDVDENLWPKSQWFVNCSRAEAVSLLIDKDIGTFLFRPKDDPLAPYVLSIKSSTDEDIPDVKHCVVFHPEGRGFGFKADGAVFESLEELVERHTHKTLSSELAFFLVHVYFIKYFQYFLKFNLSIL
ncbi:hypothetical protein Btru_053728 [Bulinus truncatus]|nr:hypothetical protein Btru_053728 [Bulinus truncatus]